MAVNFDLDQCVSAEIRRSRKESLATLVSPEIKLFSNTTFAMIPGSRNYTSNLSVEKSVAT